MCIKGKQSISHLMYVNIHTHTHTHGNPRTHTRIVEFQNPVLWLIIRWDVHFMFSYCWIRIVIIFSPESMSHWVTGWVTLLLLYYIITVTRYEPPKQRLSTFLRLAHGLCNTDAYRLWKDSHLSVLLWKSLSLSLPLSIFFSLFVWVSFLFLPNSLSHYESSSLSISLLLPSAS